MKQNLNKGTAALVCVCTVGIGICIAAQANLSSRYKDVERQIDENKAGVARLTQQIEELKDKANNLFVDSTPDHREPSVPGVPEQVEVAEVPDISVAVPLYDVALSEELQEYTYALCEYYSIVDYYEVVLGIMYTESGFNADAISGTSDYGIMQINACNHEWLKDALDIVDIMDVKNNIECGIYIFADLISTYEDANKALMAYNMGPTGAAAFWEDGIYTSAYSDKVLSNAEQIKNKQK